MNIRSQFCPNTSLNPIRLPHREHTPINDMSPMKISPEYWYSAQKMVSEVTQHISNNRHQFTQAIKTGSTIHTYVVITGSPKQVVTFITQPFPLSLLRSTLHQVLFLHHQMQSVVVERVYNQTNSSFKGKPCGTPNKDCHSTWSNGPSGELGGISIGRHSKQYIHFRVSCIATIHTLHISLFMHLNIRASWSCEFWWHTASEKSIISIL